MHRSDIEEPRATATPETIAARVRQNAGSAALAAALLIYFGFFGLGMPDPTDLFGWANLVFVYTLRIGGVAMAVITVGSLVGHRTILMVDAVVSISIGALLNHTGVLMLVDGGGAFQTIINVFCGGMFFSAGRRNGADYFRFAPSAMTNAPFDSGVLHQTRDEP